MADIFAVADIIEKMASGFEEEVMRCVEANKDLAVQAVKEQLWSGLSGDDSNLSPTYDNDPYFEESGFWHHRNADYKAWKMSITPPTAGWLLNLPPRPYNVPNLYIDGTFYSTITAARNGDSLVTKAEGEDSAEIVGKWGGNILRLGSTATEYFSQSLIAPWIWDYFESCGW